MRHFFLKITLDPQSVLADGEITCAGGIIDNKGWRGRGTGGQTPPGGWGVAPYKPLYLPPTIG